MSYKFRIDRPALAPGAELQIHGLGIFKNGEDYIITDAQEVGFRNANATLVSTSSKTGTVVSEVKLGPTLQEAFQEDTSVKVESLKEAPVVSVPEGGGE